MEISRDIKHKYYRVTYSNEGIYNVLKKMVGLDEWKKLLTDDGITWLPKPNVYSDNNRSYFTQKGFEMFSLKTLPIVKKYLSEDDILIEEFDELEDTIIYSDEYQVIVEI